MRKENEQLIIDSINELDVHYLVSDVLHRKLEDNTTECNKIAFVGQTVSDFISASDSELTESSTVRELNNALKECGIKELGLIDTVDSVLRVWEEENDTYTFISYALMKINLEQDYPEGFFNEPPHINKEDYVYIKDNTIESISMEDMTNYVRKEFKKNYPNIQLIPCCDFIELNVMDY